MNSNTEQLHNTEKEIVLSSTKSMQVSLQAVRSGKAGLDAHRQSMLNRVPAQEDWARFEHDSINLKDLAYLTAKTGDEFALLRGKKEDRPLASSNDRLALKRIGQSKSIIISARTGMCTEFSQSEFENL